MRLFFALIQGHQSKASPIEFLSWSYGAASGLLIDDNNGTRVSAWGKGIFNRHWFVQQMLLYASVVVIFIYAVVRSGRAALIGARIRPR